MQVIDKLVEQLRQSAAFNPAVQVAPAAVLWTAKAAVTPIAGLLTGAQLYAVCCGDFE